MRDFDRIKPPDQRLLERREGDRLDAGDADPAGRGALFSATSARNPAAARSGLGGLAVECSGCGTTTELDLGTALRAAAPLFLWAPWRDHPLFAVCPACGRRSWLRLTEHDRTAAGGSGPDHTTREER